MSRNGGSNPSPAVFQKVAIQYDIRNISTVFVQMMAIIEDVLSKESKKEEVAHGRYEACNKIFRILRISN